MKKLLPILAGLALTTTAHAQRFVTEVFPSFTKTSSIQYATNFTVVTGAPVSQPLVMDIYQPAGATDTMQMRPLILLLHSGSFLPAYRNGQFDGNKAGGGRNDSGLVFMAQSFAKRGYVVASVEYRAGWNPAGSTIDIRRGTLINAFVRGIQDVRAAVRFMRKEAAVSGNPYKIDPNKVIVGGPATGGALAVNYAALIDTNQLKIPKFQGSTGAYYVNHSVIGDLDGFGGNAAVNNPNNWPGYNGRANFIFAFEAIVGDSSWIIPGLPPIVSVHRQNNPNNTQPYGNGTVSVNVGGVNQQVVDVSGSGVFIPLHNADGNNSCITAGGPFTDPISVKAYQLSGNVEGLYPVQSNTAAVTWYDSTAAVTECIAALAGQTAPTPTQQCNGIYASYAAINNKAQNLLYIDTFMKYVNPRIVRCLALAATGIADAGDAVRGFSVAPNPSRGLLTVSTTGTAPAITEVRVADLTGREVYRSTVAGKHSTDVNIAGVAPGVYMLTITAGRETATQRLVVQQ